ncbi:MAG TPA: HEAT repeat domain-containing protein [Candidatus Kryptonia bacterium]|nr:HEAT repeat domain-containing protein [Candidatus Kryptonia bacterium]
MVRRGGLIGLQWAAFCVGVVLTAAPTHAQISSKQVQDRYQKQTKGGTKLEDFVKKLESSDPDQRLEGVKSLGESKEPKATAYLIQAVGDTDARVQCKAIDLLANLRADDATPVLVQYLFRSDVDPQLKHRVLAALGQIGDARAAQPIVEYLQRDLDASMRGTAIFALGELGAPEALDRLTAIAQADTDPTLRRLASEAAAKVRQRQAVIKSEVKEPSATFLEPKHPPQEGQQ